MQLPACFCIPAEDLDVDAESPEDLKARMRGWLPKLAALGEAVPDQAGDAEAAAAERRLVACGRLHLERCLLLIAQQPCDTCMRRSFCTTSFLICITADARREKEKRAGTEGAQSC